MIKLDSILIVEDDLLALESLEVFLSKISKNVYAANNANDALQLYYEHKPQIIISDINMPSINGIEMSKQIKKDNPEQPIILISANTESEYIIQAVDLNIDAYIIKPILVNKLYDKIVSIYEKIRLKEEIKIQQKIIIQSEKMVSMGEMIGNIAHQWRQPLNALSSLITNLNIKYDSENLDPEFFKVFFTKSDNLIQKMSETIDDFRNFFNPDKAKQEFDLKIFFSDTIDFFINTYRFPNLKINLICDADIKLVSFKNELMQVIINIFKNSYDAYEDNKIDDKRIDVLVSENSDNVLINIIDFAGGIDEEIIKRVFEPYFTTKYKSDGTGIGLYMSKMIIENSMEGNINLVNSENGGVTEIIIPKLKA